MPAFVETILTVFSLIAIGYGAARLKLVRKETGDGLADFVFTIAVPLLLFRTIATADFGHGAPWRLWIVYFSAILVTWTVGSLIIRRGFGRDARSGVVAGVTAAFSNLVLLGIPFITGIFGEPGLAVLSQIVSIHLPVMMAASMLLFERAVVVDGTCEKEAASVLVRRFFRQVLTNPLVIGILAGGAMRLSGLELFGVADRVIAMLGGVAGPVALFAMGVSLTGYGIRGQILQACSMVSAKLILMPACALVVALALGLPELPAKVAIAAASLPAGVNSWLIANRLGTGQRLASTAMTLGTAMAALTTGLWLAIADFFL